MGLKEVVDISREFGGNPRYVLAGGGNTSFKDEGKLFIKASGFQLATIDEDGFVEMDRKALAEIWRKQYPTDVAQREARALSDLMAAKSPGQETKRPSVETLLHDVYPGTYIVHMHPSLVNGLTCGRRGEEIARELYGDSVLWVPVVNPGYVLAVTVHEALARYADEHGGAAPEMLLNQNHGVFVAAGEVDRIREVYNDLFSRLDAMLKRRPAKSQVEVREPLIERMSAGISNALASGQAMVGEKAASNLCVEFSANEELLRMLSSRETFGPISSAYTPDHIVFCGDEPLFVPEPDFAEAELTEVVVAYRRRRGVMPKVVAVSGLGVFGIGLTEKAARNAVALLLDAVDISVYAESFGGSQFLPQSQIDFINGWEVERYRSKVGSEGNR